MYKKYHFETLDIYHLANDFTLETYKLAKRFPKLDELFFKLQAYRKFLIK